MLKRLCGRRKAMNVTVQDMMEARERRAEKQAVLLRSYAQTLLCFTMNIPGPEKDNRLFRRGFALGKRKLRQGFLRLDIKAVHEEENLAFTGCEAYYVLPLSPREAKALAADIEEASPAGRLFDLDVFRPDGSKVERQEIGLSGRKCLICDGDARVCARSRAHTAEELRAKTDRILLEELCAEEAETVARAASQSLLYEVLTTPKPGLVDCLNNGSHRDMDLFTFAASTAALHPYFAHCAKIGIRSAKETPAAVFDRIRLAGRMAEGVMLEATQGVNTHRGAVFSLGILCAAAGRLGTEDWHAEALLDLCAEMTEGLTERDFHGLTSETARTFGEKLYLQYGITGVRGEAEQGYPLVRKYGYPRLREALSAGKSINDAGCAALMAVMAHNTDTNVIHRSSPERQKKLLAEASELIREEPYPSAETLEALDQKLIGENISPGGSADLLAVCYMLYELEKGGVSGLHRDS